MIENLKQMAQGAVNTFLHNPNQFASGGLFLMAIGSVVAMLKSWPSKAWVWLKHQFTISLTINDENQEFIWLRRWLQEQRFMKRIRHLDVATRYKAVGHTILNPAPGTHWMWSAGRLYTISINREEKSQMDRGKNLLF